VSVGPGRLKSSFNKLPIHNRQVFDCELLVLQHLREKQYAHNHLMSLLASHNQSEYFRLILPWAELDLSQYWESKQSRPPGDNIELSTWLREQCCGLAVDEIIQAT
jgi:hypothetical protein